MRRRGGGVVRSVSDNDIREAPDIRRRRRRALVWRNHVQALQVCEQCRGEERRPCLRIYVVLKRVACPGKGRASLGEELSAEGFRSWDAGVLEELKALSRRSGGDLCGATELDEGRWRWRHGLVA